MRYNEIITESERVPKLSDLWRYSDEFSPEVNERARQAALRDIENIKLRNKQAAEKGKELRKGFELLDIQKDLGINIKPFMQDYCLDMADYAKNFAENANEYFQDPSIVTTENAYSELVKMCASEGFEYAVGAVVLEALTNPRKDVAIKYKKECDAFMVYWQSIYKLGPVGKKKAQNDVYRQLEQAMIS